MANKKHPNDLTSDVCINGGDQESVSLLKKAKRSNGMKYAELFNNDQGNSSNNHTKNKLRTIRERSIEITKLEATNTTSNDTDDFVSPKLDKDTSSKRTQAVQVSNSNQASDPSILNKQSNKKVQKPRRRVATLAQRRAANIRERRRMFNLNAAFDRLRKKVPSFAYEKRLSRIETLKLAIMYIRFMDDLVNDDAYAEKYKQLTANTSGSSMASGFLSSSSYLSLYGHCESPSPIPGVNQVVSSKMDNLLNNNNQASLATNEYNKIRHQRDDTRRGSSMKTEETKRQTINNNSQMVNFNCNENSCPLNQPCLVAAAAAAAVAAVTSTTTTTTAQYRATSQAGAGSPVNSAGNCCFSPTSSSATTCHSTGSTFNESPTPSSPLLHLHNQTTAAHLSLPAEQQQHQHQASSASTVYYSSVGQAAHQQYHEPPLQEPHRNHHQSGLPTSVSRSSSTSVYPHPSPDGGLFVNGTSSEPAAFFYYHGHHNGTSGSGMAGLQVASKSSIISGSQNSYSSSGHAQSSDYRHHHQFHQSQHQNQAPPDQVAPLAAYSSSQSLQAR